MKKIFITGVSSGIGEYLASQLQGNGEVYGASRNPSRVSGIHFLECDLRDEDQILRVASEIAHKEIDVFIFNAGIGYFGDFSSISLEQEQEMFQVNFWSNMIFMKHLLPLVSSKAIFIFIGSVAGKTLFDGGAGYQASKFALRGFVGSLRKELGNRCFLINPKIVETNFHKKSQTDFSIYKKTALEDIGAAVHNIIDGKTNIWEIDF